MPPTTPARSQSLELKPQLFALPALPRGFFIWLLAAIMVVLVLYPVVVLFIASVYSGQPGRWGEFTLKSYELWLGAFDLIPIFINSVIYSASRLAISLTLALLFAWAVARTNVPYRRAMALLIPIPFFIPDLLTGISWLMLGNPQNGLINTLARQWFDIQEPVINLYGWGGMIFHSSLSATALLFLLLVGFFHSMDTTYEEASVTLGASKTRTLFLITLPMMAPAILSTSILVFASGLDSFENPLVFGNPGGVYVFANEIYRMLKYRHPPEYNAATALSVILILITFSLIWLQWKKLGERKFSVISGKGYRPTRVNLPDWLRWTIFGVFVVYFMLAIVIPLVQIIVSSFFPIFGIYKWEHLTLKNWTNVLNDSKVIVGLKNTIIFATAAGLGTVILGGLIGYVRVRTRHPLGRYLELLAWTPWTLPGIVLGLAMLWAWALPPDPFNLYGTTYLVVLGFIVKGLPLGTATMQSAIHQVNKELEESSRVSGGTWTETAARILVPLMRRGILAAFVIVFALSARDLTIPLLLQASGTQTLTVALLYYYEEGRTTTLAAVAVIQLALVMALLLLEHLTRERIRTD
jgi:iron(III) transport system permease protein